MKLTVRFECESPADFNIASERRLSTRGRDADDMDMVIGFWKSAYEDMSESSVRVVLVDPASESDVQPEDIDAIDDIEDEAETATA